MLIVRVELHSAITHQVIEIARMRICNDGVGTNTVGHYTGETFVGRDSRTLENSRVSKEARVDNWRRNDYHVWNLVRQMLTNMGYTKGVK